MFNVKQDAEVLEVLNVLPQSVIDWGTGIIGADKAWAKQYTGKGRKFGIVDTGVDKTHPDLENVVASKSFVDVEHDTDSSFHGTHVAGITAGSDNGVGIIGVAHDAEIYSAKVFGASGNFKGEFQALYWLASQGVDVINMSYGSRIPHDVPGAMEYIIEYGNFMQELADAGIVLVAASGNDGHDDRGYSRVAYPARFTSVIAVGALSEELERAHFSSTGEYVEFAMPGVDVYSSYPGNKWARLSGTSMASPYLSGCVLLLQQWAVENLGKKLTPKEVREYLQAWSVDLGLEGVDSEYGYGKVNIGKIGSKLLNETIIQTDVPPQIINNRTLVPFRVVAELLGAVVNFNNDDKSIQVLGQNGKEIFMKVGSNEIIIRS